MRTIAFICVREHETQSEGPEEKASRYTVRPGTLGLTLHEAFVFDRLPCVLAFGVSCAECKYRS